jgi:hypothetical protein
MKALETKDTQEPRANLKGFVNFKQYAHRFLYLSDLGICSQEKSKFIMVVMEDLREHIIHKRRSKPISDPKINLRGRTGVVSEKEVTDCN